MSRSVSLILRATALALALALGFASAALGVDDASIAHVETSPKGLQILVSVPPDVAVDLDNVTVTIDGQDVPAAAALATSTTEVRRTAVLVIDTSNSMRGQRFSAAKSAAFTFLDSVPDDVHVGIVSFADQVVAPLSPTVNRQRARNVISGLTLSRHTRLYDGVLAGLAMAGTQGQRTLVVLSDGADTSDTLLDAVTRAVTSGDVLLDAVALEQSGPSGGALSDLATAGGGRVISADSRALSRAFSREAAVLARQILVTAQVPDSVTSTSASLAVALATVTGSLNAEAFTIVRRSPPPADESTRATPAGSTGGWATASWVMYVGTLAIGLGLVALLVLVVPAAPAPMSAAKRVSTYTERLSRRRSPSSSARIDTDQALSQATHAAAQMLGRNKSLEERISLRLEKAGSSLKSAEWLLLHAAIFVAVGVVGLLLGTGSLLVGLLFLGFGAFGPWLYLGLRASRRRKAFNASLPDTLQLMSGSLSAGLSLAQSVDTIVREGNAPVAEEFKRVLVEARLGVALEDALDGVAERFESKDFAWVVMAIKIQRQVGGNLAELLNTVAATMREREYVRRQVAALAAEGKLSAIVLGALPPLFLLYLVLVQRDYVLPLFTDPRGLVMLAGAFAWLGVGIFWMSRLIKVEV